MAGRMALLTIGLGAALVLSTLGVETARGNPTGWALILIGLGYCMGGTIHLARERNRPAVRRETGAGSLWAIAPGFAAVFFGPPLEYLYLPETLPRTAWMEGAGLILIGAAVALRVWARLSLGSQYTGRLQIAEGHRLIRRGPYRLIRHPGYAAFLLLGTGLAVGYSSILGVAAIALALLPGLAYRMRVEERLLLEQFGEDYWAYCRTTRRLIPGVW